MADIYMGETYDARLEKPGWDAAGYNDSDWSGVRILDHSKSIVKAQVGPLIIRHETIRPGRIIHSPKGETIIDFGQNMVGWVKVRARGPAGTTITIRHAEVLDQQGNLYTENLRSAKEITSFTLKGTPDGDEEYEPHFTFQGFQYIAVEGYPGEPSLDHFTGIVLHSDTPLTGSFECSNPLIDQLQHNVIWGQKGNFVDVPTDCPQRDERLGWTGDTQVFIRTACFNNEVRKTHYNLTTGFVGTPYLCHVLSRFGYTDVAYELLNQESYPSWLYPVKKGATTIWERWDGIKPDGSFQDAGMNSFNHYAYGAIGEWLYRVVAGIDIDPTEPGYKHILFQPQPGGGLTHARAAIYSPYGPVASSWELTEADFRLSITVPANTHATVRLPAASMADVSEGGQSLAPGYGILSAHIAGNAAVIEVGSGRYEFVSTGLTLAKAMAGVRHIAGRLDRASSLREWLANENGKTALTQLLGDLLQGPMIGRVMDTPLEQLALFAPHLLTAEKLDALDAGQN